ncbi:unnamed protein product [Musa hybrid cultivar]
MAAMRSAFRRFFSISAFSPPPPAAVAPPAEPSTNLFISGKSLSLSPFLSSSSCRSLFFCESLYPYVRCSYILEKGGLSKRTTSEGLMEAFSKFGQIIHARVVTDRVSGYSKGFGFVRYATLAEAAEGIKGMDGKFLDGWVIFAEYARPRPPPPGQTPPPPPSEPPYGYQ